MSVTKEQLEADRQRRQETSDALVSSTATKKLIVAGPGTGKTHNFRLILEQVIGKGLALTFIRALADDLEEDLGDIANVNTLHGYCKGLAHGMGGVGNLTADFDYYPGLFRILASDLSRLRGSKVSVDDLDERFHNMDATDGLLDEALGVGDYYDALSHTDAVYRVQKHFEEKPEAIPKLPVVVVDEYQDFSLLETKFVESLGNASPIVIAGDDDQALYGFKHASANYIRELAENEEFERFDLPYCSRCTEVVVQAVNNVVISAQKRGLLKNRLDREYLCYLPDKQEDSDNHPEIIRANCSVHMKKAPYMSEYVAEQIAAIPPEDIAESREGGYPTALVVGPGHFVRDVHKVLEERFQDVTLRLSDQHKLEPLDGYKRLVENERSNLGWRLVMDAATFPKQSQVLVAAIQGGDDLVDVIPDDYRESHLGVVEILRKVMQAAEISPDEEARLTEAAGMSLEEIRLELGLIEEKKSSEPDQNQPSVMCTSLLGAKGLQAGHVFLVGFVDKGLPADPSAISDDEVCKFLVALSRTRKSCHLVSCSRYAGKLCPTSTFLGWLDTPINHRKVDKSYWSSRGSSDRAAKAA